CERASVVGVVMRDEQPDDVARVEAVRPDVRDDLLAAVEAGVDHPQAFAGVDDVAVSVQTTGQVESVVPAADQVQMVVDSHRAVSSSGMEWAGAVVPPSTTRLCPVTYAASSEAR